MTEEAGRRAREKEEATRKRLGESKERGILHVGGPGLFKMGCGVRSKRRLKRQDNEERLAPWSEGATTAAAGGLGNVNMVARELDAEAPECTNCPG